MQDLMTLSSEARRYHMLRSVGAGHDQALDKACRGNWNPYTESTPVVTDEQRAEVWARISVELGK